MRAWQILERAVLACGMVLACCRCALALDPALDVSQYAHTSWTARDGFLKGAVRSIVQTPDGYLWLGTEFGLVRFDGVQFIPWIPPPGRHLPSNNIRCLVSGRDGTLWIGTLEGLASWKDGQLKQYAEFAGQNVLALREDREGTVWAGTFGIPKAKLCAIHHGDVECFGADGSLGQWVWSVYEDANGRLWAGAETGLWCWKPGPPKRYPMPHPIQTAQALAQGDSPAGLLAVGEGIWQFLDEKVTTYAFPTPPGRLTPMNLFRDRDGGLWVGTLQRGLLHVYQGKTSLFAQSDGLSSDHILSLFEDREANIWVGTEDGLDRFREVPVISISVKQGLSSPSVWSVLTARDHSVWLSTLDGLNRWNNGHVTIYRPASSVLSASPPVRAAQYPRPTSYRAGPEPAITEITAPGLPDNVGSLYEDDRGQIWVSTPQGIVRFERGRFTRVKGLPGGWVNVITGDTKLGVWISYQDLGLFHWLDGNVVEQIPWSKLGGNVVAASLLPDPVGGLWLGFFSGGVTYLRDGKVRASYGKSQGLGAGRVMGLQLDHDGTLWAATEGGLSRLKDGHVANLSSVNGLPCDSVHWAVEDDDGFFWLYTACGLLRVARTELEKWAADPARSIQFALFDNSQGVRSHALLTGYTPRVSKSADGKLWFAHFDCVSVIDPRRFAINTLPPSIHIEQITADGKTYSATPGLRLPPLIHDLAIDYTALSLAVPEKVRFRFLLEGQDKDWREVGNDRRVQYSNLRPRSYRFRVTACNNSGVWNEEGTFLDFSIAPAYYQTNWFRALCLAAFLGLLWGMYQLRVQQLAHQFNMTLDARVNERTRIARELHDTLLQSFQGLLLRFQTVSNLLPAGVAKQRLDSAIDQAAQAITEGRDAVQGLRSSTVVANDLAVAIRTLGEELAANQASPSSADFHVGVEGNPRDLHPILRDEVYRIAGEAMRNAFKHAEARRIEVEIRYDDRELRLRVRDDGKGIDPKLLAEDGRSGHFGLHGMRERAKVAGGRLDVWSELDAGTEVELTIPASAAYTPPGTGGRSWWPRKKTETNA